jgi:Uma2 family endonuclease
MSTDILDDVREGISLTLAPLNVDQYHQMIRDGILREGEPIELIRGTLIYKDRRDNAGGVMTHGRRHLNTVNRLTALLSRWVADRNVFLQVQGPVTLNEKNEPEPDCSLINGHLDEFRDAIPAAKSVAAVFEVADSSLRLDRQTKQSLYAEAGVPVYVIVNLKDGIVEVHTNPKQSKSKYGKTAEYKKGETVEIVVANYGPLSFPVDEVI